jgi:hypothetical protein
LNNGFIRLGLDRIPVPAPTLPRCDYIYFATPSRASFTITNEFVTSARAIVAHAHNAVGNRMPHVPHLRPGHTILLAYGTGKYEPVFRCTVCASAVPVRTSKHIFDVFCYSDASLHAQLGEARYDPDPVVQKFIGISIEAPENLRHIRQLILKPKGNNTLRRWDEVFGAAGSGPLA